MHNVSHHLRERPQALTVKCMALFGAQIVVTSVMDPDTLQKAT